MRWLEKKWDKINLWIKVIVFLIVPLSVAFFVTGVSIPSLLRDLRSKDATIQNQVLNNLLVWLAALLWLIFFWGGIAAWIAYSLSF